MVNLRDNKKIDMLVFLEFVDEAQAFIRKAGKDLTDGSKRIKIITFHPSVKAYLLERGISVMDSFHFCPRASHQRLIEELEMFSRKMRDVCSMDAVNGIRGSFRENLLFSLRGIVSTWMYRVEVMSNAIEQYSPLKVVVMGSRKIRIARSLWIESCERFFPDIAEQICEFQETEFVIMKASPEHGTLKWNFLKGLEDISRNIFFRFMRFFIKPTNNVIAVPVDTHNMNRLLTDIKKDLEGDYDLVFLGSPRKITLKNIWENIIKRGNAYRYLFYDSDKRARFSRDFICQRKKIRKNLKNFLGLWSYRRVSPLKWLMLKYKQALEFEAFNKTYYQSVNLKRFLDEWNPLFVLSQHSRGKTAVMGELCKNRKIPSLMVPHGTFTPVTDEYSKKEWKENAVGIVDTFYKYLALQTPLIEKFIADITIKSKPVVTGPLIFGIKEEARNTICLKAKYASCGEKIILHAGTPKHRSAQRFINYETIDEYVDGISELIRAVNTRKGVHLVIRYRDVDGLTMDELKSILPVSKNYSIVSDGSFFDYLSISDLLVSYSSTTIEEALQNNVPVMLFDPYNRYKHIKGVELLKEKEPAGFSAVYNVNSREDLKFALNWIIENHFTRQDFLGDIFKEYKYKEKDIVKVAELIKNSLKTEAG
ncbi:MAG: hypothetical protein ABH869_00680 [Candidatus Omnitrophota bacterium]